MRLGGIVPLLLLAFAAACDTPTLAPTVGGEALRNGFGFSQDTSVALTAHDTIRIFPCDITTGCEGIDTIPVVQPNGDTIPVRVMGDSTVETIVVGGDTIKMELGIWNNGSSSNGDFIGIIWIDGEFGGYWGYCGYASGINDWYTTTDPATGKKYFHWINISPATGAQYHYIYDPATNKLKIYHKLADGTVIFVYHGPPVQDTGSLRPPDPATGQGPWTSDGQWNDDEEEENEEEEIVEGPSSPPIGNNGHGGSFGHQPNTPHSQAPNAKGSTIPVV